MTNTTSSTTSNYASNITSTAELLNSTGPSCPGFAALNFGMTVEVVDPATQTLTSLLLVDVVDATGTGSFSAVNVTYDPIVGTTIVGVQTVQIGSSASGAAQVHSASSLTSCSSSGSYSSGWGGWAVSLDHCAVGVLATRLITAGVVVSYLSTILSAPASAMGLAAGMAIAYGGYSLNYIDHAGGSNGLFFYGWHYSGCFFWSCYSYWYAGGAWFNPVWSGY